MITGDVDVRANRQGRKYSRAQLAARVLWSVGRLLFRLSPRPAFAWRALLLRMFGADIGRHVHLYASVRVELPWNLSIGDWSAVGEGAILYNLGRITLGARVTVSQYAHLCAGTHDYRQASFPLLRPPIDVEDNAWICADAFVGPGVRVGEGAVLAARAVVIEDVEPWTVVAGNPARVVKQRTIE